MDSQSFAISLICQEINQITPNNTMTKTLTEKRAAKMDENRHFFSKKSFIGMSNMAINNESASGIIIFCPKYKITKSAIRLNKTKESLA